MDSSPPGPSSYTSALIFVFTYLLNLFSLFYSKEGKVAYSKYLPNPVELVKSPAIENGTSPRKKVTFQFSTLVQSAVESSSNCSELGIGIEAALSGVVSNKTANNRLVGSAVTHIPASSGTVANVTASNRAASKSNELFQDELRRFMMDKGELISEGIFDGQKKVSNGFFSFF